MLRKLAADAFHANVKDILDFSPFMQGMTNRSYTFRFRGVPYIMRVPGEGTDALINRAQELACYQAVEGTGLSDELFCFSKDGVKISRFYETARACNPFSRADVGACMDRLRELHEMGLRVPHAFNIFQNINRYESLRSGMPSQYQDYHAVKARVFALKPLIDAAPKSYGFTHLDAVYQNFLMLEDRILLVDWEYAAMCDQHMDIAMFAVYALYERDQIDWLIARYFGRTVLFATRMKIYSYIAAAGLLWSNWCEYKRICGVPFDGYAQKQYEYARKYAVLAKTMENGETDEPA